jgi:predicted  nucleic acid-binding Zn-ribbon protein
MAETTTQSTGIVARIMRILKLDDAGKVQSFFDREKKKLSRDITTLNKNIENVKFNSERTLDEYREQLEDAEVALENAYAGVTLADIENNAKQEEFSFKYWDAIDRTTAKVESIKQRIKDETEKTEKAVESFEKQIAELNFRISKIS